MNTLLIAVIAAAIIIVLLFILKSRSVTTIEHPQEAAKSTKAAGAGFEGFQGECEGVKYVADSYDPTTITIEIYTRVEKGKQLEVNARKNRPEAINDERAREIEALLDYGADYLDIGYNTDRIAAEFPMAKVSVNKAFAEKITRHLIRLKHKSV